MALPLAKDAEMVPGVPGVVVSRYLGTRSLAAIGTWFVYASGRGYLHPDLTWRSFCYNTATGESGYYVEREDAILAATMWHDRHQEGKTS